MSILVRGRIRAAYAWVHCARTGLGRVVESGSTATRNMKRVKTQQQRKKWGQINTVAGGAKKNRDD